MCRIVWAKVLVVRFIQPSFCVNVAKVGVAFDVKSHLASVRTQTARLEGISRQRALRGEGNEFQITLVLM